MTHDEHLAETAVWFTGIAKGKIARKRLVGQIMAAHAAPAYEAEAGINLAIDQGRLNEQNGVLLKVVK